MRRAFIVSAVLAAAVMNGGVARAEEAGGTAAGIYEEHGRRDPFWPLVDKNGMVINYRKDVSADRMHLEGIVRDASGEGYAVIDGTVVRAGDRVGIFTVRTIREDAVILENGRKTFTLHLKKEE